MFIPYSHVKDRKVLRTHSIATVVGVKGVNTYQEGDLALPSHVFVDKQTAVVTISDAMLEDSAEMPIFFTDCLSLPLDECSGRTLYQHNIGVQILLMNATPPIHNFVSVFR